MCNFAVRLALCVIVAVEFCCTVIYALPGDPPEDLDRCPTTGLPQYSKREVNLLKGNKPRFRLDVDTLKDGYITKNTYDLYIRAQDSTKKFGDVQVSAEAYADGCGTGMFDTNPSLYYQPKNCSQMVFKNTRSPEHTFAFKWTTPSCGCVLIRARVTSAESGTYFLEDEGISNGHLTKRVCPKGVDDLLSKVPKHERVDLLCKVTRAVKGSDVAKRPDVLHRRKMDFKEMSHPQRVNFKIALDQRANAVKKCCGLTGTERIECLGDDRRRRIDSFCAYGVSNIPFTIKRLTFMMRKKKECCWRLGESRYHCFSTSLLRDDNRHRGTWNEQRSEYMDEADPVNDLEDYTTEVMQELTKSGMNIAINRPEEKKSSLEKFDLDPTPEPTPKPTTKPTPKPTVKLAPKPVLRTQQRESDDVKKGQVVKKATKSRKRVYRTSTVATTSVATIRTTTKAAKDLERKMMKIQIRLECCNQGQQYGAQLVGKPMKCGDSALLYAKKIKRGRRKCLVTYIQCCVEGYQNRKNVETEEKDEIDQEDKEYDDDDSDDNDEVAEDTSDNDDKDENNDEEEDMIVSDKDTKDDDDSVVSSKSEIVDDDLQVRSKNSDGKVQNKKKSRKHRAKKGQVRRRKNRRRRQRRKHTDKTD